MWSIAIEVVISSLLRRQLQNDSFSERNASILPDVTCLRALKTYNTYNVLLSYFISSSSLYQNMEDIAYLCQYAIINRSQTENGKTGIHHG